MQWSAGAQAGFTSGQAWQSPNNNFASYNVADQQEEENSLLNHYKKWIGLRNSISQLRTGDIIMASNSASSIFSYIRKSTDATPSYLVVHNLAQARDDFPITEGFWFGRRAICIERPIDRQQHWTTECQCQWFD